MSLLLNKTVIKEEVGDLKFVAYIPDEGILCLITKSSEQKLVVFNQFEKVSEKLLNYARVLKLSVYPNNGTKRIVQIVGEHKNHSVSVDLYQLFYNVRNIPPKLIKKTKITHLGGLQIFNHTNDVQVFNHRRCVHTCQICGTRIFDLVEDKLLFLFNHPPRGSLNSTFRPTVTLHSNSRGFVKLAFGSIWAFEITPGSIDGKVEEITYTAQNEMEKIISYFFMGDMAVLVVSQLKSRYDLEFCRLDILLFGMSDLKKVKWKINLLHELKKVLLKKKIFSVEGIENNFNYLDDTKLIYFNNADFFKNLVIVSVASRSVLRVVHFHTAPLQIISLSNLQRWGNHVMFNKSFLVDLATMSVKFMDYKLWEVDRWKANSSLSELSKNQISNAHTGISFRNTVRDTLEYITLEKNKVVVREIYSYAGHSHVSKEFCDDVAKRAGYLEVIFCQSRRQKGGKVELANGEVLYSYPWISTNDVKVKVETASSVTQGDYLAAHFGVFKPNKPGIFDIVNTVVLGGGGGDKNVEEVAKKTYEDLELFMIEKVAEIYSTKEHVNLKLIVDENDVIEVHKEVLVARSNYFYLLLKNPTSERQVKDELVITDFDKFEVEYLLMYIYLNHIDTTEYAVLFKLLDHSVKFFEKEMKKYLVEKIVGVTNNFFVNEKLTYEIVKSAHLVLDQAILFPIMFSVWRSFFDKKDLQELLVKSRMVHNQTLIENQICNLLKCHLIDKKSMK